jgi:fatty acid desaturase
VDKHNRHHAHPNSDGADPDSIVESFCRRHGLAYCQTGLFDS